MEKNPTQTSENSEVDVVVYRYADVLTLMAEALARSNNAVTQEAVDRLNDVHTRAGLAAYQLSDFTSLDDFLELFLKNVGMNYWGEGCRRM